MAERLNSDYVTINVKGKEKYELYEIFGDPGCYELFKVFQKAKIKRRGHELAGLSKSDSYRKINMMLERGIFFKNVEYVGKKKKVNPSIQCLINSVKILLKGDDIDLQITIPKELYKNSKYAKSLAKKSK